VRPGTQGFPRATGGKSDYEARGKKLKEKERKKGNAQQHVQGRGGRFRWFARETGRDTEPDEKKSKGDP